MNTYIWDLGDVGKPTASLCQTARYTTIVGHNFSPTKEKKKKIWSWNKYHGKDIIIPFKSIISDGCEVATLLNEAESWLYKQKRELKDG